MESNTGSGRSMDAAAAPIVEDPGLPTMSTPSESAVMGGAATISGTNPMTEPPPTVESPAGAEYPDMEPRAPAARGDRVEGAAAYAAGSHGEGYLRLVIDVDDGEMRVVDAAVIDGPLVQTDLTGQMAYDAVIHGRRVAADSFDDLSQQHSFPPPDDPTVGHHVGTTAHFQFIARIPRADVTVDELADLDITLVRPAHTRLLASQAGAAPGLSFADAAAEVGEDPPEVVGRLHGVDLDALPTPSAEAVRDGLR